MKLFKLFLLFVMAFSFSIAQKKEQPKKFVLKTADDSVSYSIGQNIGRNLKDPNMKINFEAMTQGMKDQWAGSSILSDDQMQIILMAFNQRLMAKRNEEANAIKDKNTKAGQEFLEANKKNEGVVALASGLQYKVLTAGTGPSPVDSNVVKVHYKGTLIDGREFDSSYGRGEPAEFPVDKVIKGWTEALKLMHVGDKWMLYIPSELAYGENGAGQMIEPNALLIFEVELLEIVK